MSHKVATATIVNKILKQDRNSYFFAFMFWQMLKSIEANKSKCKSNHEYMFHLLKRNHLDLADAYGRNLAIGIAESLWIVMSLRKMEFIGEDEFRRYFEHTERLLEKDVVV